MVSREFSMNLKRYAILSKCCALGGVLSVFVTIGSTTNLLWYGVPIFVIFALLSFVFHNIYANKIVLLVIDSDSTILASASLAGGRVDYVATTHIENTKYQVIFSPERLFNRPDEINVIETRKSGERKQLNTFHPYKSTMDNLKQFVQAEPRK